MKRKKFSNRHLYLFAWVILCVIISYHLITGFQIYQFTTPFKKITALNGTTFKLLDSHRCGDKCAYCEKNYENLYLVSVSNPNDKSIINFLKNFKSPNHCGSFILFQKGDSINKNWERLITFKRLDSITIPDDYISRAFWDNGCFEHNFNIVDFNNGKPSRFRIFKPDGSLYMESMILNDSDIHLITSHWENNKLNSSDTVLQSEISK